MVTFTERFSTHQEYVDWAETRPETEHYEVVDGWPVMSPGPVPLHQRCLMRLAILLNGRCPSGFEVLPAPLDWVLWERPWLGVRQPDIVVCARPENMLARGLYDAPVLAVEVLSPSSIERDLITKRSEYARAGLQHYWVVDPHMPSITIFRNDGSEFQQVARVAGDDQVTVDEPFTVDVTPAALVE